MDNIESGWFFYNIFKDIHKYGIIILGNNWIVMFKQKQNKLNGLILY